METVLLTTENWEHRRGLVESLAHTYATEFWCGTWKELLAVRDDRGCVVSQLGTYDQNGQIYPETKHLLSKCGLSEQDERWPQQLWMLAAQGELHSQDGRSIEPFWSLARAHEELLKFVSSFDRGGYGGEIFMLIDDENIVGFTAYACISGDLGRSLAQSRFPVKQLYMPIDNAVSTSMSLKEYLSRIFPGELRFGIFLDHAVCERFRGNGLGSRLFDARLTRMLELGAQVIVGRTMTTATAQYQGNYLKRGLRPVAADGTSAFSRSKHYFVTRVHELRERI